MKTLETLLARLDAIFLPSSELLHNLAATPEAAAPVATTGVPSRPGTPEPAGPWQTHELEALLQAVGGRDNLAEADCVGLTRLRLSLRSAADGPARARVDAAASACGVLAVMWCSDTVAHLVAGGHAPALYAGLQALLAAPAARPDSRPTTAA